MNKEEVRRILDTVFDEIDFNAPQSREEIFEYGKKIDEALESAGYSSKYPEIKEIIVEKMRQTMDMMLEKMIIEDLLAEADNIEAEIDATDLPKPSPEVMEEVRKKTYMQLKESKMRKK